MFAPSLSRFFLFFYSLIFLSTLLQTSASPVSGAPIAVRDARNGIKITKPFTTESTDAGQNIVSIQSAGSPSLTGPPRDKKIINHGGRVLTNTVNVYYIYYGSWQKNDQKILEYLMSNIGSTNYYKIVTSYYDRLRNPVSGGLNLAGTYTDNYSVGKNITDDTMVEVVANAIQTANWPLDQTAVYYILGSADVNHTSGFCEDFCGFHTFDTIRGKPIKYAFVGTPTSCLEGCAPLQAGGKSPNNSPAIDGMASVIMHELVESVTDGEYNAWYDDADYEAADKCVWNYGGSAFIRNATNGGLFNVVVGSKKFLLQQLWHTQKNCSLSV
ncbi:4794_t:CDS:2 [Paraglomus brasilianum]|uniref:4794_t:CDS:1 n=1 Tax=Paraglomus brasilianum TaxID=144538 RepID=A0A9N9BCR5_9GLOM|nr:4794_t:CDS:2 [Paraglomus brasilianum]